MKLHVLFFSLILILSLMPISLLGEAQDFQKLYLEANFSTIIKMLEKQNYSELTLPEKLLLIECLARTAQGSSTENKMNFLLASHPRSPEVLAAAGILLFSQGRIQDAKERIEQALELKNDSLRTLLAKVTLLLHFRKFKEAEVWYKKVLTTHPEWKNSYLIYLLGLEVYRSSGNLQALTGLYRKNAEQYKKTDRKKSDSMKANSNLYKKVEKNQLFQVEASSENIVFPIQENPQDKRPNILFITVKDKNYKMLLDTGNTAGWIVHNRDLREDLKVIIGGDTLTEIGTESGVLDGYRIYTKSLKLGDFQINDLIGLYVPKPRPDFYDANLNPAFIRNRVVTIDLKKMKLFLKTKDKFDQDLISLSPDTYTKLPWYGYKSAYIPIQVLDWNGLAMIETGAQDIGIKLEFARKLGLPLLPRIRYLSDGKKYTYFNTRIRISAGPFFFERSAAEVWPFNRFFDRLTGLTADIYIGPLALVSRFVISFNPFENLIVLSRE